MAHSHGRINPIHTEEQFDTVETDSSPAPARTRITLDTEQPELHTWVEQSVTALATDPDLYQRSGNLVQVVRLPDEDEQHGIVRPAGTSKIIPVARGYVPELLSRQIAYWEIRLDKIRKASRGTDPAAWCDCRGRPRPWPLARRPAADRDHGDPRPATRWDADQRARIRRGDGAALSACRWHCPAREYVS